MRALAALMIAYLHAIGLQVNPPQPFHQQLPGLMDVLSSGVDIFFVLSGFIITHSASRYSGGQQTLIFLKKRFIRVNPVYYVAACLFLAISWHWLMKNRLLPGTASILKAIFLLPVADNTWSASILPVAWTLCFEWFFYLLFALAIFARSRDKVLFLSVLAFILVSGRYFLHSGDIRIMFVTNPILFEFLLGMLIYRYYTYRTPTAAFAAGLALAGITLFVCQGCWSKIYLASPDTVIDGSLSLQRFILRGIPSGLLLCGCIFLEKRGALTSLWNNRVVNWLGDASYSLYLTHYTVYSIGEAIALRLRPALNADLSVCIWLLLGIIIGVLFYRAVERPLLGVFR
jgi:exopolysaccharide production protein ExoZ